MKIGAIGIRTKIIVGDAATWYLVKKYIDGKLVGGIDDVPEELKKYVRVLGSWVDVTAELDKLAEYPTLSGDPNKFVSDDGTTKEITSSIGVVGTDLYASVEPSTLLAGAYQLKQTIDPTETQMTIIAGGGAIVAGSKFIDENPAQAFPMGTVGFDYWRKISSLAGEARKGLRFFLFDTADNSETDIFAPLWSSPIEVTDFTERQISYSVPAVNPTATQHFGVEFLFTASAANITLTYIVGDGRGWFMRLPLPLKHEKLTDKNSEAAFQHVDTTTVKPTLAEADKVAVYDSVTGEVVLTPKSNLQTDLTAVNQSITNLQNNKANKTQEAWIEPTLLNGWANSANKAMFMKDEFGFIHCKGYISGGAVGSTLFTLPTGYRTEYVKYFMCNSDGYRVSYVYINYLGNVILNAGATTGLSLDQIYFKVNS